MKFTTENLGAVMPQDLCTWDVSFRVRKGNKAERVETVTVTASERDAWDMARAQFERLGYVVGLPCNLVLKGRWI